MSDKNAFEKLKELVSIQSVSTDVVRKTEMDKAAEFIKNELTSFGCEVDFYRTDNCPPLIVGRKSISGKAPTLGLYAHYDVQPEDPVEKWSSPPFEITKRNGKLFGRGTADDKMHVIQLMEAARKSVLDGTLKNNLVFIFEGEEETESAHFEEMVNRLKDLHKIDVFYVLDSGMKSDKTPQIFYGLRGIVAFELTVRIGETDLHSGVYGNSVLNPAQIVSELMAKMKDQKTGRVLIPGFYDNLREFSKEETELLSKSVSDVKTELKDARVFAFVAGFLDSKIKPGFDINGINSGYTGQGFKTIIPSYATVKFSARLVENQESTDVSKKIEAFVKDNMPKEVNYELKSYGGGDPFYTDFKNPATEKTARILSEVFGKTCLFNRSGGSIAAAEILQRITNKPTIITGFTLPDENLHAPDENVDAEMLEKGITAMQKIFSVA